MSNWKASFVSLETGIYCLHGSHWQMVNYECKLVMSDLDCNKNHQLSA
jgi:hypothetical protein